MELDERLLIPTTGNEYDEHKVAKVRVARLMEELAFQNIEIEKEFEENNMIVDVYGEYCLVPDRCIKLAVEVDGKVGHSSKRAYSKDKVKRRQLRSSKNMRVLVLPVGNLDKKMDNYTIKSELLNAVLR